MWQVGKNEQAARQSFAMRARGKNYWLCSARLAALKLLVLALAFLIKPCETNANATQTLPKPSQLHGSKRSDDSRTFAFCTPKPIRQPPAGCSQTWIVTTTPSDQSRSSITTPMFTSSSILTPHELSCLESLLPYATEQELHRLKVLLAPQEGTPEASLAKYCPHIPWPKQQAFLNLNCREAFFGGAAGGGKSDVLLMGALRYAHVPNFHALILRKNYTLLSKAGAIMDRSHKWLHNTDAAWNGDKKRWTFPSGAYLEFGYLERPIDWQNYLGTDYQYIGWDELTEFKLAEKDENNPYLCLFRSLRRTVDMDVPLQVRATSNPGGPGHGAVKKRFVTDEARMAIRAGRDGVFYTPEGRAFVPSLAKDNPALILNEYLENLMHLPAVTRARQMQGDWDASTDLQIPDNWLCGFGMRGQHIIPHDRNGQALPPIDERECRRFATIDTAGTSREKADARRGNSPSYSVVAIWDLDKRRKWLFLRDVWRQQVAWGELKVRVLDVLNKWNVKRPIIESAHVGPPLADELRAAGIFAQMAPTVLPGMADGYRGAKLERAIASGLLTMLEGGTMFFDKHSKWWQEYEDELTSWTGHPDETADQIDASSYAAWEVKSTAASWGGTYTGK